jgi:hypothetical protein
VDKKLKSDANPHSEIGADRRSASRTDLPRLYIERI